MSEKSIDSDKAFRTWKADIESRAAAHMNSHPEPTFTTPHVPAEEPTGNVRIKVLESITVPGVWSVYLDTTRMETFYGLNAHENALNLMRELLKRHQG